MLARRATLLADEMGLGKSAQAINVALSHPLIRYIVIVCPAYLRFNWENELRLWCPGVKFQGEGSTSVCEHKGKLFRIYSYDHSYLDMHPIVPPDLLIVDEGHYLKSWDSERYKRIKPLALSAKKLIILTGTPIPNRVKELWALLSLLDPKRWDPPRVSAFAGIPEAMRSQLVQTREGKTEKSYPPNFLPFAKRYCDAKLKTIYTDRSGPRKGFDFNGASNLDELGRVLRETVMLRRTKAEVLKELPPKRRQLVLFDKPQTLDSAALDAIHVTEENYDDTVLKLESDKVLFSEWSKTRNKQAKDKVPFIVEFVQDMLANGVQKVIVFGHHVDVLEALQAVFQFDGSVLVHGAHSEEERKDAIGVFQDDPNCRVFVGSMGASGTGINLTRGHDVVFAEFDPAPYRLSQCEDRAHRMGQRELVNVYHLLWNGTLDARMAKIVVKKQEVINAVL